MAEEGLAVGPDCTVGDLLLLSPITEDDRCRVFYGERDDGTLRAVKLFPQSDPDELRVRTGEAPVRLFHDNIVQIEGVEAIPGGSALIMDCVDGPTLRQMLVDYGAFSAAEAVDVFLQVLAAVGHAHDQGVAHGALRPTKIMLQATPDGLRARVRGFGIGRCLDEHGALRQGALVRDAAYMAPEQLGAGAVPERASDMFALGVLFQEMLTGQPAFPIESFDQLRRRIRTGRVLSLERRAPQAPALFFELIMRCLSLRAVDRPQHCAELIEPLQAWAAGAAERRAEPAPVIDGAPDDAMAELVGEEDQDDERTEISSRPMVSEARAPTPSVPGKTPRPFELAWTPSESSQVSRPADDDEVTSVSERRRRPRLSSTDPRSVPPALRPRHLRSSSGTGRQDMPEALADIRERLAAQATPAQDTRSRWNPLSSLRKWHKARVRQSEEAAIAALFSDGNDDEASEAS